MLIELSIQVGTLNAAQVRPTIAAVAPLITNSPRYHSSNLALINYIHSLQILYDGAAGEGDVTDSLHSGCVSSLRDKLGVMGIW